MDQIRSWLYISGFRETRDLELLQKAKIGAMLQLAGEMKQPGITSLYLPVEDGEAVRLDLLKKGIEFVRAQKAAGQTVLVACGAGISRSSTFAVAALKEEESLTLPEALRQVCLNHPTAFPHMALWKSLYQYYDHQDISLLDAAHEVIRIQEEARPKP